MLMTIKDVELDLTEVSEICNLYDEDFIALCKKATTKDPSLTIVCGGGIGALPLSLTVHGENTDVDEMDTEYERIQKSHYGEDYPEEFYDCFPYMCKSRSAFIKTKQDFILFYQGKVFKGVY